MNYHLHHEGRDLGIFSLEELQRRRQAGELSGSELVWREGMQDWQRLESVLQTAAGSTVTPPPLPSVANRRKGNALTVTAIVAGVLIVIAGLTGVGFLVAGFIRAYRTSQNVFTGPSGPDGLDAAAKKIEWTTNAITAADATKRAREFRLRQWLEGYKANGQRDRACDAEVVRMLESWIDGNFGGQGTNVVDVSEWCDRIAATPGCDDPLLLTVAGLTSIEVHEKNRRLERALAGFPKSRHKAYPRFTAAVNLIDSTGETNRLRPFLEAALQSMKECFSDGSFRPEDQAEIAEIFINGWGYNFFYRLRPNIHPIPRTAGKSFEWLTLVLEGEYHVIEAWAARGGGYADTVTEKGWQGFSTHMAAARGAFEAAWKLRPDLPLAPARMVYVSMSDSGAEEMRLWFDRTIAAQLDYEKAWSSMRWGLRSRWHGSSEALVALGKSAVDTGRFDTDVPRKFFDTVADVESEMELALGRHIYGRSDLWPFFVRMYEGYIHEPTRKEEQHGWRAAYSVVAYFAGKYDVARAQLDAVNWEPPSQTLSGWGTDLSLMPLEVAARTGAAQTKVIAAEASYRRANVADALSRYQDLVSEPDARTASFARHRVAALELERRLQLGEWIELLPSAANDPAWMIAFGNVERLPDGALEVKADKNGHMLFSRARAGTEVEVRGEFEIVRSSTDDFQAGLVMGLPNFNSQEWCSFRMKRNADEGQVVSFGLHWGRQQVAKRFAIGRRNSFQFRFQNGRATASVNGTEVLQRVEPPRGAVLSPAECYVGLGAFNDMNDTVVRYHRVQLRRLGANRPAARANAPAAATN